MSVKYYHGFLSREDIEPLLKNDGDFLIRKTICKEGTTLSLAVFANKEIKHFLINQNANGEIYIGKIKKKSIAELIEWHLSKKVPLIEGSKIILKKGIAKPNWLVKKAQVKMVKKLGEGAFGEVFCGEYKDSNGHVHLAAIKTMHDKASPMAYFSFLKEARIMRKLDHPNIVQIFGIVTDESPLLILMELCEGGSMLSFLRKNRGMIVPRLKLRFIIESASSLKYLEQNNCIHRDIAARNCLLTQDFHIKLSDFGMSDDRTLIQDRSLDKVPIKWLAPETMQERIYSTKTDVWSFGIMGTPSEVASLVSKCWAKNPADRPSFAKIHDELCGLLIESTESSVSASGEGD